MTSINQTGAQIVKKFSLWLSEERRLSPHTIRAYVSSASRLIGWLNGRDLTDKIVVEYMVSADRTENGVLTRSTLIRDISLIGTLNKFLQQRCGQDSHLSKFKTLYGKVLEEAKTNFPEITEREGANLISDDEFYRVIKVIEGSTSSLGDYAISRGILAANLFYNAGAKVQEVSDLMVPEFHIISKDGKFEVVLGKGRKERTVEFSLRQEEGRNRVLRYNQDLADFLGLKENDKSLDSSYLLVNGESGKIGGKWFRVAFSGTNEAIGYTKKALGKVVGPSDLRTSHIIHLMSDGMTNARIANRTGLKMDRVRSIRREYAETIL